MGACYPVEVVAFARDTIGVTYPGPPFPEEGTAAVLEFEDGEALVSYNAQVVVAPREPGDGVILQRAASATYAQRRRTWRVPLDTAMAIRKAGAPTPGEAQILNLSTEGVLIETVMAFTLEERIELLLALPDLPAHTLHGRVLRVETAAAGPAARYGVGFVAVPPAAKRVLTYFMWKRLRELYPREIAALWPGNWRRRQQQAARKRAARESAKNAPETGGSENGKAP